MTRTILVTGAPDLAGPLAAALESAGAEPVSVTDPVAVPDALAGRTFQGYVQLPARLRTDGNTVVARTRQFLEAGLLGRFRLAELVAPMLDDDANVVLVAGHLPADLNAPDDQAARQSLLRVLAHAVRADLAPAPARVEVVDDVLEPAELARVALTGERDPGGSRTPTPAADLWPEMNYADWRTAILALADVET